MTPNSPDTEDIKLNITESWNINTSWMKEKHNSDSYRFANLCFILHQEEWSHGLIPEGNNTVIQKLCAKWIRVEISHERDLLKFNISNWNKEKISVEVENMWDFYNMLRKYKDVFFSHIDGLWPPYYWDIYGITENDSEDTNLFWMFLYCYVDKDSDFYNQFENERWSIDKYREERMTAIEDTLSHSWEFISGRNARRYGENPFFDMVKDDPILRKKCILFADKCADNPMFVRFIKKHVSNGNSSLYFFDFIRQLDQDSLDSLALLFQSEKFVSVFVELFKWLPRGDREFNKLRNLITNKENLWDIFSFFNSLNEKGVENAIIFLKYWYTNWEKYILSWNKGFIEHFNWCDYFWEHYVRLLCEIAILPDYVIVKMIQNWNQTMALNVYNYVIEQADSYQDFLAKLWAVFEWTWNLQHIVWLEGLQIEDRLALIEKDPKHIIEKLNQWKNPIWEKWLFWRMSYPDLRDVA